MRPTTMITLLLLAGASSAQEYTVEVPHTVLETVGDLLPEQSSAGAAFVSGSYSPNLLLEQEATVDIVFLWEGAGYRNSLGWFTYEQHLDGSVSVLESALIIADASFPSQGFLQTGDAFTLKDTSGAARIFSAGERVGFFLVSDGWNMEPLIQDFTSGDIPSSDPLVNASFGRGCYTSLDKLNPESGGGAADLGRHLAMLWMPGETGFLDGDEYLLSGFEDLRRDKPGCDNDFNDLVFIVDASPIEAIANTPAFHFVPDDPDGDGIAGISDHVPNDPLRAFLSRVPSTSERVIGCEDRYPWIGDADFNDLVLAYHLETVTDASGDVVDLLLTLHLAARGASYDHSVGWHLPGLPSNAQGAISIERFYSDDAQTHEVEPSRDLQSVIHQGQRRIPDLFASTQAALQPTPGNSLTNTSASGVDRPAASVRVLISFESPISPGVLGQAPYDLYFAIEHGDELWDVHMPGIPGFSDRTGYLPDESGTDSFLDDDGNPWMLEFTNDWRFPLEQVPVWSAYPEFSSWVDSEGSLYKDWHASPAEGNGIVSEAILGYVPARVWSVALPQQ